MQKRLQSLPLKDIQINDNYWSRYIRSVPAGIAYQWDALNDRLPGDAAKSHCVSNFKIAAGLQEGEFGGLCFQDNDMAKWLEAVAYSLEINPDSALEKTADEMIDIIEKAQQPDGYLNTFYILTKPGERFKSLCEHHELFCAGHFFEAAVAYYNATGKDKLLKVACRYADYIDKCFGDGEGQISAVCGHPEIELALVRLYRATGEKRYLKLSKFFVDRRGQEPNYFEIEKARPDYVEEFEDSRWFDDKYYQVHAPVREQVTAEGHAVRLAYLFAGVADVAYEYSDSELLDVCKKLFDNIANKRMYVTGSIGSSERGERFTADYDLPNDSNYSESCAAVGLAMFAKRMLEIERDAKYADVMERALYNTVLGGISLEGNRFFYVNPLEVIPEVAEKNLSLSHVKTERQQWFGCACCPPNIIRTLASLGQYIYSVDENDLYLNLYISNQTTCKVGSRDVEVKVETNYPFDAGVRVTVKTDSDEPFALRLRLPQKQSYGHLTVNGCPAKETLEKGYLAVERNWKGESTVLIDFEIPAQLVYANPKVRADNGKVAVVKGPVVYCLEEADNGKNLGAYEIPKDTVLKEEYDSELFGGTMTIMADAVKVVDDWGDNLYRTKPPKKEKAALKFVPYCYWNNRGKGEMLVWVRQETK